MTAGTPKRDGSGRGTRANQGRGGCKPVLNRGIKKWEDKKISYISTVTRLYESSVKDWVLHMRTERKAVKSA